MRQPGSLVESPSRAQLITFSRRVIPLLVHSPSEPRGGQERDLIPPRSVQICARKRGSSRRVFHPSAARVVSSRSLNYRGHSRLSIGERLLSISCRAMHSPDRPPSPSRRPFSVLCLLGQGSS